MDGFDLGFGGRRAAPERNGSVIMSCFNKPAWKAHLTNQYPFLGTGSTGSGEGFAPDLSGVSVAANALRSNEELCV